VGITDRQPDTELKINPSLSNNKLTLDLGAEFSSISLTIFNTNGQQVRSYNYRQTRTVLLNIDGLNTGVYMLKIGAGNKVTIIKILK
jgi:hypothetical protein